MRTLATLTLIALLIGLTTPAVLAATGKNAPAKSNSKKSASAKSAAGKSSAKTSSAGKAKKSSRRKAAPRTPSKIVATYPLAFTKDVSPDLKAITFTFNQPMAETTGWIGGGETYPQLTGKPFYDATRTTITLPVKLYPGHVYWIGLNSPTDNGFASATGMPLKRYVLLFATLNKAGQPTPIPAEMLARAKSLNAASGSTPTLSTAPAAERPTVVEDPRPAPIVLGAAPWADNEQSQWRIKSSAGDEVGTTILTVRAASAAGKNAWQLETLTVIPMAESEQYTTLDIDRTTLAPIVHATQTLVGQYRAVYAPGKVTLDSRIAGKSTSRTFTHAGPLYDYEQALYLIRCAPLKKDYAGYFAVFPSKTAEIAEYRVRVLDNESVTVPAGTFDCLKVAIGIYIDNKKTLDHTLWLSADERKALIKYDAGRAVMELTRTAAAPVPVEEKFTHKESGVSFTLPAGWLAYDNPTPGKCRFSFFILPPKLFAWAVLSISENDSKTPTLKDAAAADIKLQKIFLKNYVVRADSGMQTMLGQWPMLQFVADYDDNAQPRTEYRVYILGPVMTYLFTFRTEKNHFDAHRAAFDAIVRSFALKIKN